MAQRNPLNQRYQGDGPGGQTRKSAASVKPVSQAAASVHIKKKPQTDAEKRAARKAREKEVERKAIAKARKRAEKAKAEGTEGIEKKAEPKAEEKPKGFLQKLFTPTSSAPKTAEYQKWKKRYWILIGGGVACLIVSLVIQLYVPALRTIMIITLGGAYAFVIAAFVVDQRKVKPLLKAHQKLGSGNKSPKQIKHELEAKERAEAVEAARKAAREAKKLARRKKVRDIVVPGDEQ